MKRDKLDIVFSKLVRLSTGDPPRCEFCGTAYPDGVGLECAHIYGRRHKITRWSLNPRNAVALCHYHHRHFTERPIDFTRWLEDYLGVRHLELLRERVHCNIKLTPTDKEDIYNHLKAELKRLHTARMDGFMGVWEPISP